MLSTYSQLVQNFLKPCSQLVQEMLTNYTELACNLLTAGFQSFKNFFQPTYYILTNLGRKHILWNTLLPNSEFPPSSCVIKLISPLKWLHNMWTENATFDVDNATKNCKKILDLGPYKGKMWVIIRGQHKVSNSNKG